MPGVFINYRFADERFGAGILYDLLVKRFGTNQVFRDCVSLQPGEHYPTALRAGLEQADVLLAVIGSSWLSLSDHTGTRLLDRPEDWVRREIARALERDIPVIPVLTDHAVPPTAADLPADMRGLALCQARRISHDHFSADAETLIARITALVPELVTTELFTPAQLLPSEFLPSELLRAEHALVPFTGRRQELTELRSWATDSPQLSARLITGPAGQGKTRLAYHLCHQLRAQGWVCGLVDHNAPAEVLHRVAFMSTPTLLVLDYSETRCDQLLTLASVLLDRAADMAAPVRLLLLARASGEWERPLRTHRDHRVASLFLTLREKPLPPLVPKVLDRRGEFTRALAAFARPLQQNTDDVLAPFDIDHHRYERALDVHAAALACLLDRATDRHEEWRDPIASITNMTTGTAPQPRSTCLIPTSTVSTRSLPLRPSTARPTTTRPACY